MEILYCDNNIVVCIKPAGVLSTDEPGGLPELLRGELKTDDIRTVHRLDRVVDGLMVLARNGEAASDLSRQIRDGEVEKEYLALVHGEMPESGRLENLMYRDKARKMSFITDTPGKGVLPAVLEYTRVGEIAGDSIIRIKLLTGRTHQIRCQLAHIGHPLFGERKYSTSEDDCPIRLHSCFLGFYHPKTGKKMNFSHIPEWFKPCQIG